VRIFGVLVINYSTLGEVLFSSPFVCVVAYLNRMTQKVVGGSS